MELKQVNGLLVGVEGNTCFVCLRRHVTLLDDNGHIIFTLPYSWKQPIVDGGVLKEESEVAGVKLYAQRNMTIPELPRIEPEKVGGRNVIYVVDEAFALNCKAQGIQYPYGTMYVAGPKATSKSGLPGHLGLVRVY